MNKARFSAANIMSIFFIVLAVGVAITSRQWPFKTALFPMVISISILIMAVSELLMSLFLKEEAAEEETHVDFKLTEGVDKKLAFQRTLITFAWINGFFVMILLVGFPIAVALFVFLYVKFQGSEKWKISVIMTMVCWFSFWSLFVWFLDIHLMEGWIFIWLKMIGIG